MSIIDIIGKILTLIGALGLFLFGMKIMSESLQKVAGSKLRSILSAMTSNRFKGLLTGVLITAIIQSSSATTVMIVSFVNAGLLDLVQAVGVIMGANIGTTVTAWLISILGFKVSMASISLPIIAISFPLFFSKNNRKKSWGELLIGFAILFIGLEFLKNSVPDVKSSPEIFNFFKKYVDLGYLSIILFIFIGTLLTIVIQSSSAAMALTLVLCFNGIISFPMAAATVLGQNIGTTVTANLAALVGNVSARRAAIAHFIFNIIGVFLALLFFYPSLRFVSWFMTGSYDFLALGNTSIPIALSIYHTTFNIANTLILIGFVPAIVKISEKIIKSKEEEEEEFRLKYINVGLLSTSELSTLQAKKEIAIFGNLISKMYNNTYKLFNSNNDKINSKAYKKIKKYEDISDRLEEEIAKYLTHISEGSMSEECSRRVRAMLKIIDDMESIGDEFYHLSITIDQKNNLKIKFPEYLNNNINKMFSYVEKSIENMNTALSDEYSDINIGNAYKIENKINILRDELKHQHVEDFKIKKYNYKIASLYSDLVSLNEKVGDFVINVSESIEEFKNG